MRRLADAQVEKAMYHSAATNLKAAATLIGLAHKNLRTLESEHEPDCRFLREHLRSLISGFIAEYHDFPGGPDDQIG